MGPSYSLLEDRNIEQEVVLCRRQISRVSLALLLAGIVLFFAHSGKNGAGSLETSPSSIPSDIVWQLDYILLDDRMIADFIGTPYVQFSDSLRNFAGYDGCNEFCVRREFSSYADGASDAVSIERTLLACGTLDASGKFTRQEQHFVDDLLKVVWYSLKDDELRLYYSAGPTVLHKSGKSYWDDPSDAVRVMVLRPCKIPIDSIWQCQ